MFASMTRTASAGLGETLTRVPGAADAIKEDALATDEISVLRLERRKRLAHPRFSAPRPGDDPLQAFTEGAQAERPAVACRPSSAMNRREGRAKLLYGATGSGCRRCLAAMGTV